MIWGGGKPRGRGNRVPVPGPPEIFYGGNIAGTNDFACSSRKIIWTRGAEKICKNALQSVPVRRFNVPETYGGVQTYGWRKRTRQRPLQKNFSDPSKRASGALSLGLNFLHRKTEQRHLRGMENVPDEGGSKTRFREGCLSCSLRGVTVF